jgi:hypothetical protein
MDVHCCNCGEPWEDYFLRHELQAEEEQGPDTLATQGWRFGRNRLVVLHCPCCPKDGSGLPDAAERTEATEELADLLGDDEDGLAAELEDFDLFFPRSLGEEEGPDER